MAAVCDICGKGPGFGKSVSHSHRRTSRRWDPEHPDRARRDPPRRQQEAHQRLHVLHQGRQGLPRLISPKRTFGRRSASSGRQDVDLGKRLEPLGQAPVDRVGAHLLEQFVGAAERPRAEESPRRRQRRGMRRLDRHAVAAVEHRLQRGRVAAPQHRHQRLLTAPPAPGSRIRSPPPSPCPGATPGCPAAR